MKADSNCKFHYASNQSGEPRESHNWRQSDEQTEICLRSRLIFSLELCRVDELGAPGKEDDVQRQRTVEQ